jgi:hypothetical protein
VGVRVLDVIHRDHAPFLAFNLDLEPIGAQLTNRHAVAIEHLHVDRDDRGRRSECRLLAGE